MADIENWSGADMADLGQIFGLDVPAGGVTWLPLVAADFVSTTVYKDPVSTLTSPLTIDASNGNITFPLTENANANLVDGIGEGATWRLNWPAGWLGDGTQALVWRCTAQAHHGNATNPMVGIGFSDRGGDATNASAIAMGAGAATTGATGVGHNTVTRTTGADVLSGAFSGNSASVLCVYVPGGAVGDESNTGAQPGDMGAITTVSRLADDNVTTVVSTAMANTITDGFYPLLYACFDANGAATLSWQVKFEWAIINLFPSGEYTV